MRFLIMYCPTKVKLITESPKTASGNNTMGEKVNPIWMSAAITTKRLNTFNTSKTPISVSHIAKRIMDTCDGIK